MTKEFFQYTNSYFKNGNVKLQLFEGTYSDNAVNTGSLTFTNTYDRCNRLLNSSSGGKGYATVNTYDSDGNILTLKRYNSLGNLSDDFAYTYYSGTNKLRKVSGSADQYTYDLNGNMTRDDLNKNSEIKYL